MPRRTPPQKRYDQALTRFVLAVWGRQSGKSTGGYRKMFWKPMKQKENAIYWHILQTHNAAEVIYERYLRMLHPYKDDVIKYKSDSDKRVELPGNRIIFFKSGENYEDLRSESLDGCIIDELRQQDPNLFKMIIYPMLAKAHKVDPRSGWCDLLTTPNGFDHCYDLYMQVMNDVDWTLIHAPSTEAWWWDAKEIEQARKTMGEAEFAQEIMAEFRDLTAGRAYINFSTQTNIRATNPFYDKGIVHPGLPLLIGMDFNINPMAWIIGQKKIDDFYFFDEIFLRQSHTPEAAEVLAQKIIALGHQKMGVILCGDATSNNRQRAAAGQSDYDIVQQVLDKHKIKFVNMTPDSNPNVKDRVNTVNSKLKDGNGHTHLWFHPDCKEAIRDAQRVTWKQGAGGAMLDQTSDKERTHMSDAFGYPICALSPLVYKKGTTRMQIINAPDY